MSKYTDPIELDCPKCHCADAIVITERFQEAASCDECGESFLMDWDEDAGGNVYGLPIWPHESDVDTSAPRR